MVFSQHVHSWFQDVQRDNQGFYYGCNAKFEGIRNGTPPCRISDDPIFNSLIRKMFALTKKHYRTLDFEDLEKYKPALSESRRAESAEQESDSCELHTPTTGFHSDDSADESDEPFTLTKKPVLDSHKALGVLLTRCLKAAWTGTARVPNQFKALPNWTPNAGTNNAIGMDTSRLSSQKRRANDMPETKVRPSKKSRGTGSSMHTPLSSIQGLDSVKEDEENRFELEEN